MRSTKFMKRRARSRSPAFGFGGPQRSLMTEGNNLNVPVHNLEVCQVTDKSADSRVHSISAESRVQDC